MIDPDGEKGSEGRRKYGQAILAKKVDDDFPCDECYIRGNKKLPNK